MRRSRSMFSDTRQPALALGLATMGLAAALAGCGSSGSTTSASQAAAPSGGGGAYGGGGAPASASATTTAMSTAAAKPAQPAALITTKHAKFGTILAFGPKRMTVYLFEADHGAASACSGKCAAVWPPVTGKPQAQGGAMSRDFGTITRSDGSTQVTYHGHPLYLFAKDKDNGDAYGQGLKSFGAAWYALRPSGQKADNT